MVTDTSPSTLHAAPTRQTTRFVLVDAFRGIAALWVVLFHVHDLLNHRALYALLPHWLHAILDRGDLGVQIFFVISGFVIAHSLRAATPDRSTIIRFIARRELRLAPLYWVALALVVLNSWLPNLVLDHQNPLPTAGQVAAHLVYLQTILGQEDILLVSWTLCIEFQFYLVFVAILAMASVLGGRRARDAGSGRISGRSLLTVTYPLFALSLACAVLWPDASNPWFVRWWYLFALGSLSYWAVMGRVPATAFYVALAAAAVTGVYYGDEATLVGVATSGIFFAAGRGGTLTSWLNQAPFQFLGRVSFSLYLIHYLVVSRTLNLRNHLGGELVIADLLAACLALTLALVAAAAFYWLIERPSLNFSRRFRVPRGGPVNTPSTRAQPA